MAQAKLLAPAVGLGALAGGMVLGVLGRLATALLAIGEGFPANLSLRGLVEVAALGAAAGALGGALLALLRGAAWMPRRLAGLATGALLFAGMLIAAVAAGRVDLGAGPVVTGTLLTTAIVCLIYGMFADALLRGYELAQTARDKGR